MDSKTGFNHKGMKPSTIVSPQYILDLIVILCWPNDTHFTLKVTGYVDEHPRILELCFISSTKFCKIIVFSFSSNRWRMSMALAGSMLFGYVIFLAISILLEINILKCPSLS